MDAWTKDDEVCAEILEQAMADNTENGRLKRIEGDIAEIKAFIKDDLRDALLMLAAHQLKITAISWVGAILIGALLYGWVEHIFK